MVRDQTEVCLLASKFKNMVAKEAWSVWSKLPQHTRSWVSLEDIIQDGMIKLTMEVIPKWDGNKKSLSSFVYVSLRRHLDECYTCKLAGRWKEGVSGRRFYQKHNERNTIAIEDLVVTKTGERRTCWDILDTLVETIVLSEAERACWVVPIMLDIYGEASDSLKKEMTHWFLTNERLRLDTPKFYSARTEFLKLAKRSKLDAEDCRHLFHSPVCMDELSRSLRWVPFDLAHPTPQLAYA